MKWLKEIMPYVVILIVVLLFRSFVATPIKVNGQSMYDTLTGNEIMILNKLGSIHRYDIVVADLIVNGKKEDTLKEYMGFRVRLFLVKMEEFILMEEILRMILLMV